MLLDVYIAPIAEDLRVQPVACAEREAYHLSLREAARRQRYAAWRVLEEAIRRSFGIDPETLSFHRLPSGKWTCDKLHFSLSHTHGAVAAAVSDRETGADLESAEAFEKRSGDALAKKIRTPNEAQADDLLALWTMKEAIFKRSGGDVFIPSKIESASAPCHTQTVLLPQPYRLSVCGDSLPALRVIIL